MALNRRALFNLATLPVLPAPLLAPAPASAQTTAGQVRQPDLERLNLKADGVVLEFPRLADTGSAVPISASIEAPAGLKIALIEVFLPGNPNTRALKLRLPEPQVRYSFTTRLRLAGTQEAWVVVTLTDGSQRGASAPTVITSSACFDAS
jgi:predicted secreted protein